MRFPLLGHRLRLLLPLALLGASVGCTSARIRLESSPAGADVYISQLSSGIAKKVGVTPLVLDASEIESRINGSAPVFIEYRLARHNPEKILVTDLSSGDLKISRELHPQSGLEDMDSLNHAIDLIFEGQRLGQAGRYDDALALLKGLEKETPQLAAIYELEGGIYYLQKKYPEALDAFENAAKFNPRNPSVLRMQEILQKRLGLSNRAQELEQGSESTP